MKNVKLIRDIRPDFSAYNRQFYEADGFGHDREWERGGFCGQGRGKGEGGFVQITSRRNQNP